MESREFNEWIAYWAVEPWGEVRADHRAGLIAAMCLNAQGAKIRGRAFQSSDFFDLYDAGKRRKQSGQQMLTFMRAFAETHNAKQERKGSH